MYEHSARVIPTDTLEEWRLARRRLITASDAAAIMGLSPFETAAQVVASKLAGAEKEDTQRMWFGRMREECNLRVFEAASRLDVQHHKNTLLQSTRYEWLGCTLDAAVDRVRGEEWWEWCEAPPEIQFRGLSYEHYQEGTPIEMKNVPSKYRSYWTKEQPPLLYWCQKQAQLLVTGHPVGILVAAVDSAELYPHTVYADKIWQAKFAARARECWLQINAGWF